MPLHSLPATAGSGTTIATPLGIMKTAALLLVLFAAACGPASSTEGDAGATIAVMDEIEAGMPLDSMLALLEWQLEIALEGRLEGSAVDEYRIAEAISDRLLEARMPFQWLAAEDYSIESRLRQVQSMADRVLAQMQMSASRDTMLSDLQSLHEDVVGLRRSIAAGGRRAPPTIHALLNDSAADGRTPPPGGGAAPDPATPGRSGPLGRPVPPPDTTQ